LEQRFKRELHLLAAPEAQFIPVAVDKYIFQWQSLRRRIAAMFLCRISCNRRAERKARDRHWLDVLDDIEENSKAVLNILTGEHFVEC
jgi:hypothetical protein